MNPLFFVFQLYILYYEGSISEIAQFMQKRNLTEKFTFSRCIHLQISKRLDICK